jgi:aminoglycoside 6-adenylyltransferase
VEQTYVGARLADNWNALAHTLELFRRVAVEVGELLGYAYPHDLHQRVSAYVDHIKQLERPVAPTKNNTQS